MDVVGCGAAAPAEPRPSARLGRPPAGLAAWPTRALVVPAAVGLAAFLVYLVTLSRGVLGGDAGELQFVPPILGLTHPTGYPLQVLLHFAWSQLPLGSVAYRLNLLDAALAAAAVSLVVALTRALGTSWPAAAVAGASLAFGELWWSQAVRGDKYTLNGLFLALVLLLFLRWRRNPSLGRLSALALACGLSLAHHRSMLLVAPALLVGLLLAGWRPRPARALLQPAALALLPLALYAYVPWAGARGLPPGSWPVDTPAAVVEYLLDRGYTSQIRPDAAFGGRLAEEAVVLVRSFGPLGAALGLVGLASLLPRDWRAGLVLGLAFAPQAVLGASYLLESHYQLPRHWVFFLPAFLIWAVWLGVGLDAALRWIGRLGRLGPGGALGRAARAGLPRRALTAGVPPHALAAGLIVALVLAAQAGTAWVRGAVPLVRAEAGAETLDAWRQDLQRSPLAGRFGRLALDLAAPGATIVCDWEQATVLWYLQRVEGLRPDLTIRYPVETLDDVLARARAEGRAVYLARTLPGLEARGVVGSVGPLLQVSPAPDTLPATASPLGVPFEGGLALAGVVWHAEELQPGSVVPFTLYWRADAPLAEDVAVSVRLLAPDGRVLARHDERHPALGTSPTSRWAAGQVVGDYHELPLGSRLAPGVYRVQVVPYRAEPIHELDRLDGAGQPSEPGVTLPPLEVRPRRVSGPLDLLATLLAR